MEENTGRKKSGFAAGLLTGIVIMAHLKIQTSLLSIFY